MIVFFIWIFRFIQWDYFCLQSNTASKNHSWTSQEFSFLPKAAFKLTECQGGFKLFESLYRFPCCRSNSMWSIFVWSKGIRMWSGLYAPPLCQGFKMSSSYRCNIQLCCKPERHTKNVQELFLCCSLAEISPYTVNQNLKSVDTMLVIFFRQEKSR